MRAAIEHSPWVDHIGLGSVTNKTARALRSRGIIEADNRRFTPLGLAVKAHLEAGQ